MKEFSTTPAPTELEVEQLTPYLRQLLIFICVASFFEAYLWVCSSSPGCSWLLR